METDSVDDLPPWSPIGKQLIRDNMNSAERILKSFLPYLFMKQRKMRKEKETVTKF